MSLNLYQFNPEYCPTFLGHEEINNQDPFIYSYTNPLDDCHASNNMTFNEQNQSSLLHFDDGDQVEVPDIPDTCFNYITNLLSEEDLDDQNNVTLQDYMAAQIIYKSLDAALLGDQDDQCQPNVCENFITSTCFDDYLNMFSHANHETSFVPNNRLETHQQFDHGLDMVSFVNCESINSIANAFTNEIRRDNIQSNSLSVVAQGWDSNMFANIQHDYPERIDRNDEIIHGVVECCDLNGKSKGRKHGYEGNVGENEEDVGKSSKQLAPSNEVFEQIEQYGDVLLCPEGRSKPAGLCSTINKTNTTQKVDDHKIEMKSSKGSKKRGGKSSQVVDLKSLLSRCAQCVARVDLTGAYELLKQIRQNSSPSGGYLQRVAHYLANGLEARLEGKGLEISRANEQIAPCEVLKANRVYVASVPFKIMSYYTTNKTIAGLVDEAPSVHIIDFGIFYGLQWPCIIQNLSKRPSGPPKVRITGIDFPQRGFRPAERVEETGRCLAKYCERYNVPFEYHGIAKKWEDIKLEELNISRNEPLVVNCLYRSHNLFDESVEEHSPRDAFLSLVRQINPDIFMHGIVNSTLSVPFFLNRFKEAMFHYTALFDLFEATMKREDNERMILESKLYGNQALNVIACEGTERVERPESYKQWQVRTQRAGFVQVPLDRELLRRARAMVRRNFREEFSHDEDDCWVVQGWKGRILYAISCWKPQ